MSDPIQFTLAALLLLATPGPTNTVMATAGAVNRSESPWLFMLAELCGYLAIIILARLALLPLINTYPWIGIVLKGCIVAFLLYTAIKLWHTHSPTEGAPDHISARIVFLTTLLNPKGLIFAIAIIPHRHAMLFGFFAGFALLVLAVGGCWFIAGRTLGVLAGPRARILPRIGSLALFGFAGYLATSVALS